ncbi:hypothetical protein E2986_11604 [Frieseomelitta varia]|uniref:Uncharacterized protein n=1 Tax=Frieseomelitta varia TaxID=561572 RepID=A0A833WFP5_9HYME|nr:hypothetical protein E2986_11604 [Frieseomelitta varia]
MPRQPLYGIEKFDLFCHNCATLIKVHIFIILKRNELDIICHIIVIIASFSRTIIFHHECICKYINSDIRLHFISRRGIISSSLQYDVP